MFLPSPIYLLAAVLALPALLAQAAPAVSANDIYHVASKPLAKHYCNVFGTICHELDNLGEGITAKVKECKAVSNDNFRLSCIYYTSSSTTDATNYTFGESQFVLDYKPGPLKNFQTQLDDAKTYCNDVTAYCGSLCKGLSGQNLCRPASLNYTQTVDFFECKCAGLDFTGFVDQHVTDLQMSG